MPTRITAARPDDPVCPVPDSRYEGMTVRQFFAAVALAGVLARPKCKTCGHRERSSEAVAELAVRMADRTLERLGVRA